MAARKLNMIFTEIINLCEDSSHMIEIQDVEEIKEDDVERLSIHERN